LQYTEHSPRGKYVDAQPSQYVPSHSVSQAHRPVVVSQDPWPLHVVSETSVTKLSVQ
jgi:hypothetical protein